MKIQCGYGSNSKQRQAQKRLRWEKIHLTRTQRKTLSVAERKGLYENRENPCTCVCCSPPKIK